MASAAERRQQKAQKKKVIILVIMALATAMTWGKALFGKDEKPAVAAAPTAAATPIPGAAGGAGPAPAGPPAVTTSGSTSISSYDQAVHRMEVWPTALKRRVHVGQIEEILPFESEAVEGSEPLEDADPGGVITPEMPPPVVVKPDVLFEELRLKLSSTAIMGKSRYARINGVKVTVGQIIEVQVGSETIRYEVSAINPREVEIRYSGETYLLRIKAPGLNNRAQEGA